MGRNKELAAVTDWKKTLWIAVGVAAGVAAALAGLSALIRGVYLVGILYGLGLAVWAVFLAGQAMRVEHGETAGPVEGESAFGFLFSGAGRYPQCLVMSGVGLVTVGLTLTVALAAGTTSFARAEGPPDPIAQRPPDGNLPPNFGQPPPVKPQDPPKPPAEQGSSELGLRAYWSFDEGKGDKARDAGKHGLVATVRGCKWVPGVRGTALEFNGKSDCVELDSSKALNFADGAPFTISWWMKTSKVNGYVLSFRHNPDTCDLINVFLTGGKLAVWVRHQGDLFMPDATQTAAPIHDGKWRHYAIMRGTAGQVTLYLDGEAHAKLTSPARAQKKIITNQRALGVEGSNMDGKNGFVDQSRLDGCLDEVRIYGEVLPEAEIRKLAGRK